MLALGEGDNFANCAPREGRLTVQDKGTGVPVGRPDPADRKRAERAFDLAWRQLRRQYPEVWTDIDARQFRALLRSDFQDELDCSLSAAEGDELSADVYELGRAKLGELRRVLRNPSRRRQAPSSVPPRSLGRRGRYARAISKRSLALAFVAERVVCLHRLMDHTFDTGGARIPWRLLAAEWNHLHPKSGPASPNTLEQRYRRARQDESACEVYFGDLDRDGAAAVAKLAKHRPSSSPPGPTKLTPPPTAAPLVSGEAFRKIREALESARRAGVEPGVLFARLRYRHTRDWDRTTLLLHRFLLLEIVESRASCVLLAAEERDELERRCRQILEPLRPIRLFAQAFADRIAGTWVPPPV